LGWRLVRENSYVGTGEVIHFELYKKGGILRRVQYKVVVKVYKDDEVVWKDEQKVSQLVGMGLEKINDLAWMKFMDEYYKRWKEEAERG